MVFHPGEAVRHGDGRVGTNAVGYKQPAPQNHITFDGELDILSLHRPLLPGVFMRHNTHDACTSSE
jgi:hypothetical protein